jgi:hypothetical protein
VTARTIALIIGLSAAAVSTIAARSSTGGEAPLEIAGNRLTLTPAESRRASAAGLLPTGVRSILKVDRKLTHGQFVWDERGAPQGDLVIRVNLRLQMLSAFRGGHEIGTAVILYGADSHATPTGTFPIMAKLRDHRSATYDNAPMPYTLRLTADGVAIHGSAVGARRATHGCVGVPLAFARRLFAAAKTGDRVQIVAS